jgi:hypothetical protein
LCFGAACDAESALDRPGFRRYREAARHFRDAPA